MCPMWLKTSNRFGSYVLAVFQNSLVERIREPYYVETVLKLRLFLAPNNRHRCFPLVKGNGSCTRNCPKGNSLRLKWIVCGYCMKRCRRARPLQQTGCQWPPLCLQWTPVLARIYTRYHTP